MGRRPAAKGTADPSVRREGQSAQTAVGREKETRFERESFPAANERAS